MKNSDQRAAVPARAGRRLLKAVAAGAAGLALLLGGGTFALWYDSESISGSQINSGQLHFELGDTTWRGPGGDIADIGAYLITPGDTVHLWQQMTITALGDDMQARFTLDASGVTGDSALRNALIPRLFFPPQPGISGSQGVYTITAPLDAVPVTAYVTISFPTTVEGLTAQAETVDLSSIRFQLAQVGA